MNVTNRSSAATFEPSKGTRIERIDSGESKSSVLIDVAAISLSVMVGLIWLAASIYAAPIDPFETTDQPVRRNLARAPDQPVALSSAAGRTPDDYWSEVGKATGAF